MISVRKSIHALLVATSLCACSTVPEETNRSHTALLSQPPAELSTSIETSFRKKTARVDEVEITRYLNQIAARLFPPGKNAIVVELVNTIAPGYEPMVWVIPNGKIFVDVRILKLMRFENELAAALALGWDRSVGNPFRERMIQEATQVDPNPAKVWIFSDEENQVAVEASVDRIYKAGYDPRGLVTYFDRLPSRSRNRPSVDFEPLKDKTRRAIAVYAPLLNPIVRTEEFYRMRKRLERL